MAFCNAVSRLRSKIRIRLLATSFANRWRCHRLSILAGVLFLFPFFSVFSETPNEEDGLGAPNTRQGKLLPLPEAPIHWGEFILTDLEGGTQSLAKLSGKSVTVIVFLYDLCPMSKRAVPILQKIQEEEGSKGVQVVGVFVDKSESGEMKNFRKEYGLTFPLLVDTGNKLASALATTVVPQAFLVDRQGKVRYSGRIDDGYQVRGEQSQTPIREDLKEALRDVLAGSTVRIPRTLAVGCGIAALGKAQLTVAREEKVTYHKDVAPILRAHCMACHSPGNAGPFPLLTYDDAVDMMRVGLQEIRARRMPPAQVESDLEIVKNNTLTPAEVEMLRAWIQAGSPEGNPATAMPLSPLPNFREFQKGLGPPDIIIEQGEPFHLGPVGRDVYRHLVFSINSDKDLRVRAVQMLPSDRSIVHHALIGYMPHSEAQNALREHGGPGPTYAEGDSGPGFWDHHGIGFRLLPPRADGIPRFSFLSAYVPGTEAYVPPDDADYIIPAGSDIVVQMHYHRNGKQTQDSTRMGLWLRKEGEVSPKVASILFVHGDLVVVPAGIKNMRIAGHWTVPEDCTIAGLGPHAHMLARSVEVTADIPGRGCVLLVRVPRWEYDWQQPYFFKEPFFLPKGTTLTATGIFDNSADNPRNPFNPPQPVFLGEATTDEMLLPMLVLGSEKQIDPHGGSFTRFGASMARANFLRDIYNDRLCFEVQPDGTVLRVAYTTTYGELRRLKKPVDPTVPPTAYEKD